MAEAKGSGGLTGMAAELRRMVSEFDAGALDGEGAVRALESFVEIERLAGAGKALAAQRVEATRAWQGKGVRSAAHFVAATCGSSVHSAVEVLETARRLEELPATAEALRAGKLSASQAREVTSVAKPEMEKALLATAEGSTLRSLQERCRAVRSEGTEGLDRYEKVRASRYLRHWTDSDGALRLEAKLCPDEGAKVLAAVQAHRRRIFAAARADGRRESYEAYDADALVAVAEASAGGTGGKGPTAVVHVLVDHAALVRGHVEDGETCEIPGVGPIPVASARRLADDGVLKLLVTKGVDIVAVAHRGRTIPAHLRTALEARDAKCVIPGCDVRDRLEVDHVRPFAEGGPTSLDNLARMCHFHHYLKTHQGWSLAGRSGAWTWDPPP